MTSLSILGPSAFHGRGDWASLVRGKGRISGIKSPLEFSLRNCLKSVLDAFGGIARRVPVLGLRSDSAESGF
jgi:hypothetical protein